VKLTEGAEEDDDEAEVVEAAVVPAAGGGGMVTGAASKAGPRSSENESLWKVRHSCVSGLKLLDPPNTTNDLQTNQTRSVSMLFLCEGARG
jgi:hypothetical protein